MIRISHLSKVYPGGVTALRDISLEVRPGEVISVIGPSGCGKSTLVRCIEGLEAPSAGTIETGSSRLGMVFQQFNVFPHLSVLDNVTLGYSCAKLFNTGIGGRVYLTAQNVLTVTKYKGIDPEIDGGYDGNIYPRPLMGILGLCLNF